MGLCKCPKKKVTNLFCFEHRVNVCEHCLVESHSKCVVQSYLSWLADSDYDTNCTLCSMPLESKETVRLKCLHLFHWDCLDAWARRLPANTAPAGYKCQQCQDGIFPTANQTSPTIERLRSTLQRANWARAGLGLSLLPELDHSLSPTSFAPSATMPSSVDNAHNYMNIQAVLHKTNANSTTGSGSGGTTATVVDVEKDEYVQREQQNQFIARKSTVMSDSDYTSTSPLLHSRYRDEDLPENKYKRRAPFEWLFFWSQFRRYKAFVSQTRWKRGIFYVILFILLVMTVFMVFTRVIQAPLDDDPALDLLANPNIRIAVPEQSQ